MQSWLWLGAITLAALVGSASSQYCSAGSDESAIGGECDLAAPIWEQARRLTRSTGESRTSINFARSIAADTHGGIHLAWREQAPDGPAVYYKCSPDGGLSWGPPVRLGDCPGTSESGNPSIAVTGDAVHVVWFDMRTGMPQVFYTRSSDAGLTWSPDVQISDSPVHAAYPCIAVEGDSIHVVHGDLRDGNAEVYYLRSLDGGNTWQAGVRLSDLPDSSYTPTVAVSGLNVYVAWTDTRHGGSPMSLEEEYFARSTDGGTTWGPNVRLTTDPRGEPANSWAPSLVATGSSVWITWFDDRAGQPGEFDIFLDHSDDFGATWSGNEQLTYVASGTSVRPVIALHGSDMYITWWDTRDGNEEVYAKHSPDLGQTWESDIRLTSHPGASTLPSIAASVTGVHVVWTDNRDGNAELYYMRAPGAPVVVGNGRIAFTRTVGGLPQIFTAAPDGSDVQQLTTLGANQYPAWSRDGAWIAFTSNPTYPTGSFEIWMMHADGSGKMPLTAGTSGGNFVPDWSYDGTRIAFASVRPPAVPHPEVWVMNADGTQQTQLTTTPSNPDGPTWSLLPTWRPDDTSIYYASTASGTSQIWGMLPDGQGQHQKTNGLGPGYPHANAPEWSRSGDKIVFWAGLETQYGELWTMNPDGSGPQQITVTPDPLNSDNPSWSPDGSLILFDTNQAGPVQLWTVGADGAGAAPLIPDGFSQTSWQLSVDISAPCPADLDGDGSVGSVDFLALLAGWGPCAAPCPADLDGDCTVGILDFLALLGAWGPCPP